LVLVPYWNDSVVPETESVQLTVAVVPGLGTLEEIELMTGVAHGGVHRHGLQPGMQNPCSPLFAGGTITVGELDFSVEASQLDTKAPAPAPEIIMMRTTKQTNP